MLLPLLRSDVAIQVQCVVYMSQHVCINAHASFAGSRAPRLHGEVPHLCCSSRAHHQLPEGTALEVALVGEGHVGSAAQEAVSSFMVLVDSRHLCRGVGVELL